MATVVKRFIGSNGDVLIPVSQNATNSSDLVSDNGVYYIAQVQSSSTPVQGNPIGLLLALTYANDQ